ncbi:hypothetical protein KQI88_07860 [Alkaliphilus sp. MSJ-5]|uniref:Uncharacterized protein n=1 Tax=Alkaliphilus flagellatus TaxID=2841507 RepID=A0ABS6G1G9_9FIRM|nr:MULTISPECIES: hypothetical protein [Alkaliphilus]MBU5676329.1 hypothetical protein [Alkaliphilus flagellatus]QUH19309.1 hypothetical protein HYG84_04995 [Alkaliphilus sp. B6464]
MESRIEGNKKAEINMRFSEFEVPPMQDVLIVGKRAPIGPEAARRMVDILSPDQYEIVRIEDRYFEAIVVRKSLLNMLPQDKLIKMIMEEGGKIANDTMIIRAQIRITLNVSKSIDLW